MTARPLSQICTEFGAAARPLVEPLGRAITAVGGVVALGGSQLLAGLRDVRHAWHALMEKVAEQQAYVLIFGPLKSGKSTLMNAIAAAYVSEVSCLPAYPCLVFVGHGQKRRFQIIRYDGGTEVFDDAAVLGERIRAAHVRLAERIRAAEAAGDVFDPQQHFPEAIRRIDVKVPAPSLADAGAMLVDTPGLYSRMKFGYGQMTRDFRDAAACAVFVVKSDNLFLEQVFAEFEELLGLFSRIFLVVNLDSSKRDLQPGGELAPSVEQTEPELVVSAFESLVMTAPLKQAADEGRLRIYPVDLMRAASARLKSPDADIPADFARFHAELSAYLASPDYVAAFLGDSLRRAHGLVGDLGAILGCSEVAGLEEQRVALEEQRREIQDSLAAAERLLAHDWERAFADHEERLREAVKVRAHESGLKSARLMDGALDQWFRSSASLRALVEQEWRPAMKTFRDGLEVVALDVLDRNLLERDGGMDEADDLAADLRALAIDLQAIRRAAAEAARAEPLPPVEPVVVDPERIPLKRTVVDLAMLRGLPALRNRVFGTDPGNTDQRITSKIKQSRLGEPARRHLRALLVDHHGRFAPATIAAVVDRYGGAVARGTAAELRRLAGARRDADRARAQEADRAWSQLMQVLTPLRKLVDAAAAAGSAIETIAAQHGNVALTARRERIVELPRPAVRQRSDGRSRTRR